MAEAAAALELIRRATKTVNSIHQDSFLLQKILQHCGVPIACCQMKWSSIVVITERNIDTILSQDTDS